MGSSSSRNFGALWIHNNAPEIQENIKYRLQGTEIPCTQFASHAVYLTHVIDYFNRLQDCPEEGSSTPGSEA